MCYEAMNSSFNYVFWFGRSLANADTRKWPDGRNRRGTTDFDARRQIPDQFEQHSAGLHDALAKFDRGSVFTTLFESIRALEQRRW